MRNVNPNVPFWHGQSQITMCAFKLLDYQFLEMVVQVHYQRKGSFLALNKTVKSSLIPHASKSAHTSGRPELYCTIDSVFPAQFFSSTKSDRLIVRRRPSTVFHF